MIKCILWGGYGWGNAGDELTLAVALRDLRENYGASVAILSPVPGYTKALFPDVQVVPYTPVERLHPVWLRVIHRLRRPFGWPAPEFDLAAQLASAASEFWAQSIQTCELLYLVGGGYLTDLFHLSSYLLPVQIARAAGVAVKTAPLGIGPLQNTWSRRQLKHALRHVHVSVRDADSQALCHQLGIVSELRPDDGFRIREVMAIERPPVVDRLPVGINFHRQHGAAEEEQTAAWWRAVVEALVTNGFPVAGFCFHNTLASDFSQTVQLFDQARLPAQLVAFPEVDFRTACQRLMSYQAIITARFHAVVVAGVTGLPAIAVANGAYYRSKMAAACKNNPASQMVEPNRTEPERIVELLRQARSQSSVVSGP